MKHETRKRAEEVFDRICEYKARHDGCSPPFEWLVQNTSYRSKSGIWNAVDRLREMGKVRLSGWGKQGIEVVGARWVAPESEGSIADGFRELRERLGHYFDDIIDVDAWCAAIRAGGDGSEFEAIK